MQNKQILLVDDDVNLVRSLGDFLSSHGYLLTRVGTAEAALETLETESFDLILLDIEMPGMGGIGFLRQAFTAQDRPACPVIVITARSDMSGFFENLDVAGFLSKPCDGNVMLRTIEDVLKRSKKAPGGDQEIKAVLLIENGDAHGQKIVHALAGGVYRVTHSPSGPEALELAPQLHPDIILIQNALPDINPTTLVQVFSLMPSTRMALRVVYNAPAETNTQTATPTRGTAFIASNAPQELRANLDRLTVN